MIFSKLSFSERLRLLHPGFAAAFDFLKRKDLSSLAPGTYELDGRRVYAMIGKSRGVGQDAARLETHKRYIDIQFTIEGAELIGCADATLQTPCKEGWNLEKDICFLEGKPDFWLPVPAGCFAIFFPEEDAHAPMACDGENAKAVMKILK